MKSRYLVLLSIVVTLAACRQVRDPDEPKILAPQAEIQLTEDGLARVRPGERLTIPRLEAAYEGYTIAGSDDTRRWAIRDGGDTLALVDPDPEGVDYRVKVVSPKVRGPAGIRVGGSFADLEEKGAVSCRRGGEAGAFAHCTLEEVESIVFVFDLEGATTGDCYDDCEIPREHLDGLRDLSIRTIDYLP